MRLLLVLVVLMGACADTAEAPAAASSPTDPAGERAAPFQFIADTVTGGQVTGADLAGHDVALWFWAPW